MHLHYPNTTDVITRNVMHSDLVNFMLIDSPKDVVFAEIWGYINILAFLGVNWAKKWTEFVHFGYASRQPKLKVLKDSANTVSVS